MRTHAIMHLAISIIGGITLLPTLVNAQEDARISCRILGGGSSVVVWPGPPPAVTIDDGPKIPANFTDGNVTKKAFQIRFRAGGNDYMFVLLPEQRRNKSGQTYHAAILMLGSEQIQRESMRLLSCE